LKKKTWLKLGTSAMSLNLVVDANMLLAAMRGKRTLSRLQRLQAAEVLLVVPMPMKEEVDEHLPRFIEKMLKGLGASEQDLKIGLSRAWTLWQEYRETLAIFEETAYSTFELSARRRVPHDPDDWPCVALALALGASLLTDNVRHLGRSGIGVWDSSTVDVLIEELEEALEKLEKEGKGKTE